VQLKVVEYQCLVIIVIAEMDRFLSASCPNSYTAIMVELIKVPQAIGHAEVRTEKQKQQICSLYNKHQLLNII